MSDPFDLSNVGKDIVVTGISFAEGMMEIQYMEKREQTDDAGLMRVLVLKTNDYLDSVDTILDEAGEIVDKALLKIRNPERSFDPRKRLRGTE